MLIDLLSTMGDNVHGSFAQRAGRFASGGAWGAMTAAASGASAPVLPRPQCGARGPLSLRLASAIVQIRDLLDRPAIGLSDSRPVRGSWFHCSAITHIMNYY